MNQSQLNISLLVNPSGSALDPLIHRERSGKSQVAETVSRIRESVRESGDPALLALTRQFDGCSLRTLCVPESELQSAGEKLSDDLKEAIDQARCNIRRFHDFHQIRGHQRIQTMQGIECFQKQVAIDRVGLYIPGGTHPLFSSLLMLGVPASLAGCREVVVCTPPDRDRRVHPAILYCARLLGINQVFRVGGAQAVAAMAYGTVSVPAVNKIFGPGNEYVTEAKMQVAREGVAIDMPAGPSELMVVADKNANPVFLAADLLSQLEHGPSSSAVLLSLDQRLAEAVKAEMLEMIRSAQINSHVRMNLKNTLLVVVKSITETLRILNEYAPEHLSLAVADPESWVPGIRNAGSVFLGSYAPEAVGDYASGTNHTLPTGGFAKSYSGVTVASFQKTISFQKVTPGGLLKVAETVETLAGAENLPLHANSVALRRLSLDEEAGGRIDPVDLLARHVREMDAYSCARAESCHTDDTLLDANEFPVSLVKERDFNRYPDPLQTGLSARIAAMEGWKLEQILMGNGSDELIDLLIRGFCVPGRDRILVAPPTYGMYAVCARSLGVEVVKAPLTAGFRLDSKAVIRFSVEHNVKVIFLVSPNNPTGNLLDPEEILSVTRETGAIVVVDEAYIDFSGDPGLSGRISAYGNLFVLRTFSKSWGAAAVRVGLLIGNARVLEALRKIQAPYNVSGPDLEALDRILDRKEERDQAISKLVAEREFLSRELARLNCVERVYPSRANFLLVVFCDSPAVMAHLGRNGLRVRDRSDQLGCENSLRITIGTVAQNRRLLECLKIFSGGER